MIQLHPSEAVPVALRNTRNPVSFLVGAPLAWHDGHGVPTVAGVIELIREEVAGREPDLVGEFDARLGAAGGPMAYQQAMHFLQGRFDPEVVGLVMHKAVLRARRPDAPALDPEDGSDGAPEHWQIPVGIDGLARLIRAQPDRFAGPVLTTNFDPLIGLALEAAGLSPDVRSVSAEGSAAPRMNLREGQIDIFHLHGYWRDSPTLHTPAQLRTGRPQLEQSLQRLLGERTLVVIAYGGWDDVITESLANCFNDVGFRGRVCWCFHGDSEAELRERNAQLFARFSTGIGTGRIQFYKGVDGHRLLPDLAASFGAAANFASSTAAQLPVGWEKVDAAYLEALPELRDEEAVRYFDGAVPTFRHATSPLIPRLSAATELAARLAAARRDSSRSTLQLIRAAGGDGKSTALLQVAADAARSGDWEVLWRPKAELGLLPDAVATLGTDRHWLLVADDAETLGDDLWESAERLHGSGRSNVMFLLASRDADWRGHDLDLRPWQNRVDYLPDLTLGAMTLPDAEKIVDAWAAQGDAGLRALVRFADRRARAENLTWAAREGRGRVEGESFLGALLQVRFDDAGLSAHVRTMLDHLRSIPAATGPDTLLDALVYVAACHSIGIAGLNRFVLAELLEVPREWVGQRVILPLGMEVGVVQGGGLVMTRHGRVAAAIVAEAVNYMGIDLGEVWDRIVGAAVEVARQLEIGDTHGALMHPAARLQRELPHTIPEDRRNAIAIAAAEASMRYRPERLDGIVDLGRVLRSAGAPEKASELFLGKLPRADQKVDYRKAIRGYYTEWSICSGASAPVGRKQLSATWLGLFSLADQLRVPLDPDRVKRSCAALTFTLPKLLKGMPDPTYRRALSAATYLGWKTELDPRAREIFTEAQEGLDKSRIPPPASVPEACEWILRGAQVVYRNLDDLAMKALHRGGYLSFAKLEGVW